MTAAIVVIVAAAAATSAWALDRNGGPAYRTAAVTRGSVAQTLTTTGELSPVHLSEADFQVAGTVAKVDAKVGQKVTAGEVLAHLDRSELKAALGSARSTLTSARQRLSDAESGQASVVSATATYKAAQVKVTPAPSPSTSSGPSGSHGGGAPGGHRSGPVTAQTLRHDQAAVVAAQHATDAALADAKAALATEVSACASETSGSGSSGSESSGSGSSGSGSSAGSATTSTLSCTAAAKALLHDQQVVNQDEIAVDSAEQTLSTDLATAVKALKTEQKAAGSSSTGSNSGRGGSPSSTGSTGGTTVTAADLASDQAGIDTASAAVATARASLRQATLHAAISGTVAAVTISKGDSVSGQAGSTSDPAVEIIGSHQDKATVYLSDTQVRRMKVGLAAQIVPDGSAQAVTGRVVGIAVSGSESETGSLSYPVTIDVSDPGRTLVAGADAAVAITLSTANDVIAVPTSAVHYQGSSTYVELMTAGKPTRHAVTVGAVGPALTQVTSGLSVGQRVELADLDEAVPSSKRI